MTMHVLSAGDGYSYYTNEVATGDATRDKGRDLGDYYTADGNLPGRWVGSGLEYLGVSGEVTEAQMKALYGEGLHPDAERLIQEKTAAGATPAEALKEAQLGRRAYGFAQSEHALGGKIRSAYDDFERIQHREPTTEERRLIRARVGAIAFRQAKGRQPIDKEELGTFITAATRKTPQAVTGFDLVLSPAKSVSVLWALGDDDTRRTIEAAHEKAIADTIGYLEKEAIATRAGTNGVAQIEVKGGINATQFRHYDSRNGDPQLHDHLVVANKVLGVDGRWRSIDSKLLHRQGVAASEFYNQHVMTEIADRLGVAIEARTVTAGKRPVMEVAGVDGRLLEKFSSRSADIRRAVKALEKDYRATHGRTPDAKARIALAQQATLDTRPAKLSARSLKALRQQWMMDAGSAIGDTNVRHVLAHAQLAAVKARKNAPAEHKAEQQKLPDSERVPFADRARAILEPDTAARTVVATVSEHHAVWGAHHIEAETRRYLQHSLPGVKVSEDDVARIVTTALRTDSLSVTPPSPHAAFKPLTRSNGASIYEHKGRQLFTSRAVLDAEDTLLTAGRTRTQSPITDATFNRALTAHTGHLDAGQQRLAREFATSSAILSVGIGPAGAGKTTAMKLAVDALKEGRQRVHGLASSQAAATVLGDELGITTHTIHSFLTTKIGQLGKGDVVLVDEAGMAGTMNLARLVDAAENAGAHVRLLGDDRQLSAVESGGALRLLDRELGATRLEELHRFSHPDEATASLQLRDGDTFTGDPFAWYLEHGRVTAGTGDTVHDLVFTGWQSDVTRGRSTIMLAHSNTAVAALNARAQAYRISTKHVTGRRHAPLRDGLDAYVGDVVVTRKNDNSLHIPGGTYRVSNNDVWDVTAVHRDGSLTVRHHRHDGVITLPASYVDKHVELGYASTLHRGQGLTVDTSHTLADESSTRAAVYVGMSRGRHDNHLYVHTSTEQPVTEVLEQIAANHGVELSAHESIRVEQDRISDLGTLIDEYADVTGRANEIRFTALTKATLGDTAGQALVASDGWPAVAAALARAEREDLSPAGVLLQSHNQRDFGDAEDIGAVMSWRMETRIAKVLERKAAATPATPTPEADKATVRPLVAEWIAPTQALRDIALPAPWREHLTERHNYLKTRLIERGTTIAL